MLGHRSLVLDNVIAPTEKQEYMQPLLEKLFSRMKALNIAPPVVIWVDDFAKYEQFVMGIVRKQRHSFMFAEF